MCLLCARPLMPRARRAPAPRPRLKSLPRSGPAHHSAQRRGLPAGGRMPSASTPMPGVSPHPLPLHLPRRRSPRSPSCARGPRRPRPSGTRGALHSSPVRRGQSRSGRRCPPSSSALTPARSPPRKTPSTPSGRFPPELRSGGTGGGTYTGRLPASGTLLRQAPLDRRDATPHCTS